MPVNDWHFYVQDERYVAVPWTAKSDDVQDERSDFLFQTKSKYLLPCTQCRGAMDDKERRRVQTEEQGNNIKSNNLLV